MSMLFHEPSGFVRGIDEKQISRLSTVCRTRTQNFPPKWRDQNNLSFSHLSSSKFCLIIVRDVTMIVVRTKTNMKRLIIGLIYFLLVLVADGKKRIRHSGRLLGRPDPIKCSRRPRQLKEPSTGHYYLISEATNFKVSLNFILIYKYSDLQNSRTAHTLK